MGCCISKEDLSEFNTDFKSNVPKKIEIAYNEKTIFEKYSVSNDIIINKKYSKKV
jgi:hypothetical protein